MSSQCQETCRSADKKKAQARISYMEDITINNSEKSNYYERLKIINKFI